MARRRSYSKKSRRAPARGSKGRFVAKRKSYGRKARGGRRAVVTQGSRGSKSSAGPSNTMLLLAIAAVGGGLFYMKNKSDQQAAAAAAQMQARVNAGSPFPASTSVGPIPSQTTYMSAITDLFRPTMQPG